MSGRRSTAPCGHPGTHVIGQFVLCDQGCGTTKTPFLQRVCPKCGVDEVEIFVGHLLLRKDGRMVQAWHCLPCGHVFE